MRIVASVPLGPPPEWALLQRQLLDNLGPAADLFVSTYLDENRELRFGGRLMERDGVDDFYECFWNWPLAYVLGAPESLLNHSTAAWEGITRQLTRAGLLVDEYEPGYDWFHQGESQLLLYLITMARSSDPLWLDRVRRFADIYVLGDGAFDHELGMIRAPHTGSSGARVGLFDSQPDDEWWALMLQYGLPVEGVAGASTVEELATSATARHAMFEAMQSRLGVGDVLVNLAATSLVTTAFLATGDEVYRRWVLRYVRSWMDNTDEGELVADNRGPEGGFGERFEGRKFGGHYGWSWPHGLTSVLPALTVGMVNAYLLSGDASFLNFLRAQLDLVVDQAVPGPLSASEGPYVDDNLAHFSPEELDRTVPLVPHRRSIDGWFENRPFPLQAVAALASLTGDPIDRDRANALLDMIGYERATYRPFRDKEESGHEQPWLDYLAGRYPNFPADVTRAALAVLQWRCDLIRNDQEDLTLVDIHHFQQFNPIVVEALCQLIGGSPPPIYNGGLYLPRLVVSDQDARRPGLPAGVACLVNSITSNTVSATLVNTSVVDTRSVRLDSDAFHRSRFTAVTWTRRTSEWPGSHWNEVPREPEVGEESGSLDVGDSLEIVLPPATRVQLLLHLEPTGDVPHLLQWEQL